MVRESKLNFFKELPKPVKFQFGITDMLSNLETSQVPSVGSLNMNIKVRILSMTKMQIRADWNHTIHLNVIFEFRPMQ